MNAGAVSTKSSVTEATAFVPTSAVTVAWIAPPGSVSKVGRANHTPVITWVVEKPAPSARLNNAHWPEWAWINEPMPSEHHQSDASWEFAVRPSCPRAKKSHSTPP